MLVSGVCTFTRAWHKLSAHSPSENETDEKYKQSNGFETERVKRVDLSLEFLYHGRRDGLLGRPAVEEGRDKEVFQLGRVGEGDEVEKRDDDGNKERKVNDFHDSKKVPALERGEGGGVGERRGRWEREEREREGREREREIERERDGRCITRIW